MTFDIVRKMESITQTSPHFTNWAHQTPFPVASIWFQSLIPLIVQSQFTITDVDQFNKLLFGVCSLIRIDIILTFLHFSWVLTTRGVNSSQISTISLTLVTLISTNWVLGVVARSYIRLIHSYKFNTLGY